MLISLRAVFAVAFNQRAEESLTHLNARRMVGKAAFEEGPLGFAFRLKELGLAQLWLF